MVWLCNAVQWLRRALNYDNVEFFVPMECNGLTGAQNDDIEDDTPDSFDVLCRMGSSVMCAVFSFLILPCACFLCNGR